MTTPAETALAKIETIRHDEPITFDLFRHLVQLIVREIGEEMSVIIPNGGRVGAGFNVGFKTGGRAAWAWVPWPLVPNAREALMSMRKSAWAFARKQPPEPAQLERIGVIDVKTATPEPDRASPEVTVKEPRP